MESDRSLTQIGIWRRDLEKLPGGPARRTFTDWCDMGSRFARLAGGGTFFSQSQENDKLEL